MACFDETARQNAPRIAEVKKKYEHTDAKLTPFDEIMLESLPVTVTFDAVAQTIKAASLKTTVDSYEAHHRKSRVSPWARKQIAQGMIAEKGKRYIAQMVGTMIQILHVGRRDQRVLRTHL